MNYFSIFFWCYYIIVRCQLQVKGLQSHRGSQAVEGSGVLALVSPPWSLRYVPWRTPGTNHGASLGMARGDFHGYNQGILTFHKLGYVGTELW